MLNLKFLIYAILLTVFALKFVPASHANSIEKYQLPISKLTLELELVDELAEPIKKNLISRVDQYIHEGTELFGGPPKKLNGDAYTKLRLKISNNGFGGEADPEFVQLRDISDRKLFGFYGWEIGLIHEVLHLWSAETFRYVDDQEQWFNEGVTEYLTFRIAAKLGLINKEDLLTVFAMPISTYLSAKGIGQYSLRSAAKTKKLKQQNYFLVYHGGFTAGMILDHQMRLRSNNNVTIDRLMKDLYKTHSRENRYTSDSLLRLINKSTKSDFSDFFDRYIDGKEIMTVGNYFDIGRLMLNAVGMPNDGKEQQVLSEMLTFEEHLQ